MYSEYGAIGGRESTIETVKYAIMHPFIGTGNSARNIDTPQIKVPGHTVIFSAWAFNGIGGLIFWLYACIVLISFAKKFYLLKKKWVLFIMLMIFQAFWNILFSPFGYFRGFICVIIAYSAIELTRLNKQLKVKKINNN